MQAELLAFLRSRKIWMPGVKAAVVPTHREVEGEYPFLRRGEIVAYADAIDILTVGLFTVVNIFEVKPKIESIFAAIRQAKALLNLAEHTIQADAHYCNIVVPATDPLLYDLRFQWRETWGWEPGATAESWIRLQHRLADDMHDRIVSA